MSGKYFSKQVKYHEWSTDDGERLLKQSGLQKVKPMHRLRLLMQDWVLAVNCFIDFHRE